MTVIPQIIEIEIELYNNTERYYDWDCVFKLKEDNDLYKLYVTYDKKEKTFDRYHMLYMTNQMIDWERMLVEVAVWEDHIFAQIVQVLKKYSKYRLQFLFSIGALYTTKHFVPKEYEEIKVFRFKE